MVPLRPQDREPPAGSDGPQYAVDNGGIESIFVREGRLTEGSHTNVFAMIDGEVRTYPGSNYILRGVTRDVVIEMAHEKGIPVRSPRSSGASWRASRKVSSPARRATSCQS